MISYNNNLISFNYFFICVDFFAILAYNILEVSELTSENLLNLVDQVIKSRAEYQFIELKAAREGAPKRIYDTLSSFSNSNEGGIIIFGVDEQQDFELCGVYDLQDIQQRITEQCNSMTPEVRPLFSYAEIADGYICAIEVPPIDITERPCFYTGKGRLRGSYIRVGTNDVPMTEYEVYSYEAYRKKYQDDIRIIPRVTKGSINTAELENYFDLLSQNKPNLSKLTRDQVSELVSITIGGEYSLTATLLFSLYPQAYFPQLCIIATAIPGTEVGQLGDEFERFIDNRRIEGTIPEMLTEALSFVRKNLRIKTIIDPISGKRQDVTEYPLTAVREILLNALVHRDYSVHTEGMPIQLQIFSDRIEITNPGGLYGRITLDQLGQIQPDTRNPVLATALETLKITENRYSGIPTVRREMLENGLPMPQFEDSRGMFKVTLFGERKKTAKKEIADPDILTFCSTPRTRKEIADFLGVKSQGYAISAYITPLVNAKKIRLTNPKHPRSPDQKYLAIPTE